MTFYAGRAYYVYCPNIGLFQDAPTIGAMAAQITYTDDGSAPTPGDFLACQSQCVTPSSDFVASVSLGKTFFPGSTVTMRTQLSFWRVITAGSSRGGAWQADGAGIELMCFDMGTEV
jgi:hypothetical protein